ncbi:hypothetical protein, partial [Mesorhizobium sp. M1C.F.Ca.ET.195.01.1.1]|uniref:hypothetical protein n=1 Tax=Mesorhizobium sp. M1C.F.Ca.ET.195.01.1.1 TaxID=2563927 RepID=UPI001AED6B70
VEDTRAVGLVEIGAFRQHDFRAHSASSVLGEWMPDLRLQHHSPQVIRGKVEAGSHRISPPFTRQRINVR